MSFEAPQVAPEDSLVDEPQPAEPGKRPASRVGRSTRIQIKGPLLVPFFDSSWSGSYFLVLGPMERGVSTCCGSNVLTLPIFVSSRLGSVSSSLAVSPLTSHHLVQALTLRNAT